MQEVIIYRNPAEAALWNMLLTDVGFAFSMSLIVFLISVFLVDRTIRRQLWRFRRRSAIWRVIHNGYVTIAFGLVNAGFCGYWLLG